MKGTKIRGSVVLRGVVVLVALTIGAGAAGAAIPDGGVIRGCYKSTGIPQGGGFGKLRVVDDPAFCATDETPISWQQQGVPGPTGPQGPQGPQGPAGPQGPSGEIPENLQRFGRQTAFDQSAGPHNQNNPCWLGEVRLTAADSPPPGFVAADGQVLPVSSNQALFSLLHDKYGGNGATSFALPNLNEDLAPGDVNYVICISGDYPAES